MEKLKECVFVGDMLNEYGKDWTKADFNKYILSMSYGDMREVTFPDDKEFFRKVIGISLSYARLPDGDYSEYNFENIYLEGVVFTKNSILPRNRDFFQKLGNKSLCNVTMPRGNYSEYDFNGVDISRAKFTKDSILPVDKNLFQRVKYRDLNRVVFPEGDYSEYNFNNVNCTMSKFTFDSLLPEDSNFLRLIYDGFNNFFGDGCIFGGNGFNLTKNILKNIHNYDLSGVEINLNGYEDYLTESQLSLLRVKYKEDIEKNIFLPEMGMLKEIDSDKINITDKELII